MRILVCGSRSFKDSSIVRNSLYGFKPLNSIENITVIHGGSKGADHWADVYANLFNYNVEVFLADWDQHGKSAGPIRNQRMIDKGNPDVVLAFIDKPLEESRGTADLVRRAIRDQIRTYVTQAMMLDAPRYRPMEMRGI